MVELDKPVMTYLVALLAMVSLATVHDPDNPVVEYSTTYPEIAVPLVLDAGADQVTVMLVALGAATTLCGAETESVCTATALAKVELINIPEVAATATNNKMSRRERKSEEIFFNIRTSNSLKIDRA